MTQPATNPEPAQNPNLRDCITCGGPIAFARTVDNHLLWLDREPDPDGELRIFGAVDDQPTAMYGLPTTTLGGFPLPDLTTYSRHDCPGPVGPAAASATTADDLTPDEIDRVIAGMPDEVLPPDRKQRMAADAKRGLAMEQATTADTGGDRLPSGMTLTAIRSAAELDEYTDGPAIGFVRNGADMRAILARLDRAEAALAARDAHWSAKVAELHRVTVEQIEDLRAVLTTKAGEAMRRACEETAQAVAAAGSAKFTEAMAARDAELRQLRDQLARAATMCARPSGTCMDKTGLL